MGHEDTTQSIGERQTTQSMKETNKTLLYGSYKQRHNCFLIGGVGGRVMLRFVWR